MMAQNPVQDAFEIWKKALDDGTQAWVRALGQTAAPQAAPAPPDLSQFWRPILGQGMDLWQKAAAQGGVSPEFAQQWKTFLDQWIDAWSKALGQAMATEGFAQALGRYLDQTLAAQGPASARAWSSTRTRRSGRSVSPPAARLSVSRHSWYRWRNGSKAWKTGWTRSRTCSTRRPRTGDRPKETKERRVTAIRPPARAAPTGRPDQRRHDDRTHNPGRRCRRRGRGHVHRHVRGDPRVRDGEWRQQSRSTRTRRLPPGRGSAA